ncbi:MAG: cytochrome c biogenesis protein ResB [Deltaproteobacteria bacterium]|jgi:cytochrome c biogenesis protein|nr:cytochrome c biogenesis protein ResB [Deltaproteobacteria bacterium]
MNNKDTRDGFLENIWKFFASVRLTIVLLLTLAATSIIGTLIPQNESPQNYLQAFGDFGYRLFDVLGFLDLYHSWWYQTLMLLLAVNILVCSFERLSATWRIIFPNRVKFNLTRFRNLDPKEEFTINSSGAQIKNSYQTFISRSFRHCQVEETDEGYAIFGEKGRWTRMGVYIVHLSIICMLVGGVIGSIFGFEGFVNLAPGESAQHIRLINRNQMLELDFAIRCDDFKVSFYPSGAPEEFRASLSILEQGEVVKTQDIIVNDPLHYKGISIFQASYGPLPPRQQDVEIADEFTLIFSSKATGMNYQKKVTVGQTIEIPEDLGKFTVNELRPAYNFRGQDLGATFVGTLQQSNGVDVEVVLPLQFPSFDKMGPVFNKNRKDDIVISVSGVKAKPVEQRYFTGLQVSRDPGVWVVYTGFILIIAGCFVTFFMSHRQICVDVVENRESCRISVSGTANKNKLGNERKVKMISQTLKDKI